MAAALVRGLSLEGEALNGYYSFGPSATVEDVFKGYTSTTSYPGSSGWNSSPLLRSYSSNSLGFEFPLLSSYGSQSSQTTTTTTTFKTPFETTSSQPAIEEEKPSAEESADYQEMENESILSIASPAVSTASDETELEEEEDRPDALILPGMTSQSVDPFLCPLSSSSDSCGALPPILSANTPPFLAPLPALIKPLDLEVGYVQFDPVVLSERMETETTTAQELDNEPEDDAPPSLPTKVPRPATRAPRTRASIKSTGSVSSRRNKKNGQPERPTKHKEVCSSCSRKGHLSSNSKACPYNTRNINGDEKLLLEKEAIAAENRKASKRAWWSRNKDAVKERRKAVLAASSK